MAARGLRAIFLLVTRLMAVVAETLCTLATTGHMAGTSTPVAIHLYAINLKMLRVGKRKGKGKAGEKEIEEGRE